MKGKSNALKKLGITFILASAPLITFCSKGGLESLVMGAQGNSHNISLQQAGQEDPPSYQRQSVQETGAPSEKQDHTIPPELIYAVIQIESSGNPLAQRYEAHIRDTSYGLMQILTSTARELSEEYSDLPRLDLDSDGIITSEEIKTVLLDPEKNVQYGTRMLEKLYGVYDSLELAVAAYNAGPNTPGNAWTQHELNELLHAGLSEDGIIGRNTKVAVRQFQKKYGLEVDGIPGPITKEKLNEVYQRTFPDRPVLKGIIPNQSKGYVSKVIGAYRERLENQ